MVEQLIAEVTECDSRVALEVEKPKNWLKSANTLLNGTGGTLPFDIADDRTAAGLQDIQKDAEAVSHLIKERIVPIPNFTLSPIRRDNRNILALQVASGRTTPYYYKTDGVVEAYTRTGSKDVIAPDYVVNEPILKRIHRSFDGLMTDPSKKDYSSILLEATYLRRTGLRSELSGYVSFGLMDKDGYPANAGKLLTDQRIVFNSKISCTRWNELEKGPVFDDALDDKEYEGNLIYLLQNGSEFTHNNSKACFAKEARYRVDKPDYAERAVTEAPVNALIHRSYIILGSEIRINIYDDRVEIVSPGGMSEDTSVQEYDMETIRSARRNPVIADLFHHMKYMERRGSGLRKIVNETEKLPDYTEQLRSEFFSTTSDFRVVLGNINHFMDGMATYNTIHDAVHDDSVLMKQNRLLEFCIKARSRDEMQASLEVSNRFHFSKPYLKPLLESG